MLKREQATRWLHAFLGGRERAVADIRSAADSEGFSWSTLQGAAADLGIERRSVGFGPARRVVWSLPAVAQSIREGSQSSDTRSATEALIAAQAVIAEVVGPRATTRAGPRATTRAGAALVRARDAYKAQGLTGFLAWAMEETGKSQAWVYNAMMAARVEATLPETRSNLPAEDLAALARVDSPEVCEAILADVIDKRKLTGIAATRAIRAAADDYLLIKNPERKLKRKKASDQKKAEEMRNRRFLVCDNCGAEVVEGRGASLRMSYHDGRPGRRAEFCDRCASLVPGSDTSVRSVQSG